MRTAAAAFVEAHHAALERMLRDVGTPGAPGRGAWQPGETDLEAAALVLQLLQWLVPHHKQHRTGAVQDLWSKAYVYAPSSLWWSQTAIHIYLPVEMSMTSKICERERDQIGFIQDDKHKSAAEIVLSVAGKGIGWQS